jgi:hypothetical protein
MERRSRKSKVWSLPLATIKRKPVNQLPYKFLMMDLLTAVHPRFRGLHPFQFLAVSFIAKPSHQIKLVTEIDSDKNGGHHHILMSSILAVNFIILDSILSKNEVIGTKLVKFHT